MAPTRILVVEDEPIYQASLVESLEKEGYWVTAAATGSGAWRLISEGRTHFDVVLLDRMMPDMDGIDVLRRLKEQRGTDHIPVIMQTAMAADADIAEGLRAGAYYYLTKPFSTATLLAIVGAAVCDGLDYRALRRETERVGRGFGCLRQATFSFRTPEEARNLAALIANAAPNPGRVVLGLSELMLNAIEHGNLAIGYDEKTRLIESGRLQEEIARRLASTEFAGRAVSLAVVRGEHRILYTIRDQGRGFDWTLYLELSPERAFDTHGRGIAMSRLLSFDKVEYLGCGNEVVASLVF